jgi:hypothetical protein
MVVLVLVTDGSSVVEDKCAVVVTGLVGKEIVDDEEKEMEVLKSDDEDKDEEELEVEGVVVAVVDIGVVVGGCVVVECKNSHR